MPLLVLTSLYYPTNAPSDIIRMINIHCYTFRHQGAIFRELLQHRYTDQPGNTCFVLSHKRN